MADRTFVSVEMLTDVCIVAVCETLEELGCQSDNGLQSLCWKFLERHNITPE